jgi:drug/metabolite transporter (DMT)-like permease
VIFLQNGVGLILMLFWVGRGGLCHLKTNYTLLHLSRSVFGCLSYYLYFVSIRYLELVDATLLNYTSPFFVPFVWWVWIREKVDRHAWWSIILGFIGVGVILRPTAEIFQLGFVIGLFAGLTSAVALCSVRILNVNKEPMFRTLFYLFFVSLCLSFPFAWASWVALTWFQWAKILALGVAIFIGQVLLTIAYRHGTAVYLSPLGYSTVIYAGLISYFIFGAPLGVRSLIGAILIIIGGTATYLMPRKPKTLADALQAPKSKDKAHL